MNNPTEEMLKLLDIAGVKGKQLKRACEATEPDTLKWLHNIHEYFWKPAHKVYIRHPEVTWKYYSDHKMKDLQEVVLLRVLLKKLYKAWYEKRPFEIKPPKAGTRKHAEKEGSSSTRKSRKKSSETPEGDGGFVSVDRYDSDGRECSLEGSVC